MCEHQPKVDLKMKSSKENTKEIIIVLKYSHRSVYLFLNT